MADTLESLEIEVKHKASGADSEIAKVTAQITAMSKAIAGALPKLKEYAEALAKVGGSISGGTGSGGGKKKDPLGDSVREKIRNAGKYEIALEKVANAQKQMETAFEKGNETSAWRAREKELNASAQADKYGSSPLSQEIQDAISSASQIDVLEAKLASLKAALNEAFATGNQDKAYEIQGQIIRTSAALDKAQKSAEEAGKSIKKVGTAAKSTHGPLKNFIDSLKRIAFYRFIRSIIKNITQAFTEGMEKAYLLSSKMQDEGGRFAESLDRIKSAGNAMKVQLGSAFMSLLAAIEPVVLRIITLITQVADAMSQLFSAFTGNTYVKATATAAKFSDALTKGAGAAKEWKNQILGFDEINRLNEPSGGGGGGGTNPLEGFDGEAAQIEEKYLKFAEKVKEFLSWVKDHMDTIKTLAEGVGIALLAWKIGHLITQLATLSPTMDKVLGIALAIGGAFVFIKGACDAWKNGVDWDNLTLMIVGVAAAAVGLGLAFGGVAAAVTLLIGGVAMLVIGVREWIKTGELSEQTFWLLEAAIIAVGVALGILIGWPAALIAGFTAALGVIIYYWDKIIGRIATAIQAIREFFSLKAINDRWDSMQADGSVYLTGFASGGFPDEGSLFVANEAGPEMVGTIGGRTAVAPSNDIVEAVRQGVYDAVVAANANGNNDVNLKVFLDSREIRAGQERLARAWG